MEIQKQISEIDNLIRDLLKELEVLLYNREYTKFMHTYQDSYENVEDTVLNVINVVSENITESTYNEEDIENMFTQLSECTNKFMDRTAILIRNHVNEIEKMASR